MRRWLAGIILLGGFAAGCAFPRTHLVRREAVVTFAPDAAQRQHLAARRACSGIPHVVAEPLPTDSLEASQRNNVRFDVAKADDADLARLYECLRRQPGVVGVDVPDVGG